MRRSFGTSRRAGFTLVELLISMTLMMLTIGIALPFFMTQSRALTASAGRMDAQLNSNFALDAIDRDLRVAGVGIVARQPLLVQGASDAITFNADLTTKNIGDFSAVYYDPDAATGTVGLLWPSSKVTLPNSAWLYPDSAYWQNTGIPSDAETISYWVEADPQSSGFYRMMRRVNNTTATIVARGIKKISSEPFFRYFELSSTGALQEISQGTLPIRHVAGWHGSSGDTAKMALVDSVRLVRVKLTTVFHDPRTTDVTRSEERTIRITNAGLILATTCGLPPISPTALTATPTGTPSIVLTWSASLDEAAGEKDVERYAIYRRDIAAATFGEPIASVAAGLPNYTFTDTDVQTGQQWLYGIAAQDCTPASSSIVLSAAVTVP